MPSFDFVTDDELRASLDEDAAEMAACLGAKAYKAAHVLAGSIVEAILVDHLTTSGYALPKGKDLRELGLGELIAAARSEKVISERAADLASAVKSYRNLIHPGRLTRLQERVDENTAAIAGHVVGVIVDEVAALRQKKYGYTAQQLGTKVEDDSSSLSIFPDLVANSAAREVEKLLIQTIPGHFLEISSTTEFDDEDEVASTLSRLRRAHRMAFDAAPEEVKRRVCKEYVRILREAPDYEVRIHETNFFRAADLAYMDGPDAALAKKHLLSQVGASLREEYREPIQGIGAHASAMELEGLVSIFVKYVRDNDTPARRRSAAGLLIGLHSDADGAGNGAKVLERLEWLKGIYAKANPATKEWLDEVISSILEPLPFRSGRRHGPWRRGWPEWSLGQPLRVSVRIVPNREAERLSV